mgnify:CR=1 FL=1
MKLFPVAIVLKHRHIFFSPEEEMREKREEELAEMEAEVKENASVEVEVIGKNKEDDSEEE